MRKRRMQQEQEMAAHAAQQGQYYQQSGGGPEPVPGYPVAGMPPGGYAYPPPPPGGYPPPPPGVTPRPLLVVTLHLLLVAIHHNQQEEHVHLRCPPLHLPEHARVDSADICFELVATKCVRGGSSITSQPAVGSVKHILICYRLDRCSPVESTTP
ncbi:hypothetical protein CLOP_g18788 [Closterium sp. NIES-67]|nr:hypothetical protein CLOP_g18788 [Closterium sp. NIES-67]